MAQTAKNLIIVESPSKAKTIGKYLGSRYKVMASVGHVRDLPKSRLGVEIENDFEPDYINIRGKGPLIKELKSEAKKARKVYLATDPDREGEAISWHLAHILGIDEDTECRIEFNEVTKDAVKAAIKKPRTINMDLVDAQQARRVLDRIVGYQISPLLWRKVQRGLSAGRVQSAALKIICDRENEIENFKPEEYWTINAIFEKGREFSAKLLTKNRKKLSITSEDSAKQIEEELKLNEFTVNDVAFRKKNRKPYAPFTTSSLQQEAGNKLGFSSGRTMRTAQQLYEGINIRGKGATGLITYLRTDSVRISVEGRSSALSFIEKNYGKEYVGNNYYSNKKKDIQDAHEAIRPTDVNLTPDAIKDSLSLDQYKLYRLIWARFIASMMSPATYNSVKAEIKNGDYVFSANGKEQIFDGYLKVYKTFAKEELQGMLPELKTGETLKNKRIDKEQSFTQPPPRYTEASLVKELEEKEIGRPSTYAPIVTTLLGRKYIKKEKKSIIPTKLGFLVTDLMSKYFKEIVDCGFTADMENKLDDVELSKEFWKDVIRSFYKNFEKELVVADKEIEKLEMPEKPAGENCEKCGKPMLIKMGRFGEFMACSGYPDCKNTKPIVKKTGVKCPKCGKDIVKRKSKKGKIFYGCSGYPNCDMVFWDKPTERKCPECGSLLVEKKLKNSKYSCSNKECKYKE